VKSVWLVAKVVGAVLGGLVLLVALYVGLVIARKSVPFVFSGDLETLAASGPYNDDKLASDICGTSVDFLGADSAEPATALPTAKLLSWRLVYPLEGIASAHITGVGVSRLTMKPTGRCEGTITFRYRCAWVDNGRAVVLDSSFLAPPTVVRQ